MRNGEDPTCRLLQVIIRRNSMPVRVYLFKHTASETLERTTGKQDSGLELEDPNKWQ